MPPMLAALFVIALGVATLVPARRRNSAMTWSPVRRAASAVSRMSRSATMRYHFSTSAGFIATPSPCWWMMPRLKAALASPSRASADS
ncbi:MAG: hypothetical protein Q8O52_15315 [Sulfuritalea sp.]|nr:hypothetical protein [Sulfuritalea sp.]